MAGSWMFGYETANVKEVSDDDGGRVVFENADLLQLLECITYRRIHSGSEQQLIAAGEREVAVRDFLHDYAIPELFDPVSESTVVLAEETIGADSTAEHFAVVRLLEGSSLTDGTGRRLDSTRALLIFPKRDYMYMLELGCDRIATWMLAESSPIEVIDRVDYRRHAGEDADQPSSDREAAQREFKEFVKLTKGMLRQFKSTIQFR
jgi:hypothetical protein